jgi:cell division protein FtsA
VANDSYLVAIDIGSNSIKIVVAKRHDDITDKIQVLSLVEVPSAGIRHGIVTNMSEATEALSRAVIQTESIIGLPVKKAVFGISTYGVDFKKSQGLIINSRSDGEITDHDIDRLVEDARKKTLGLEEVEVLHMIPKGYKIDTQSGIRDPRGMIGRRLEASILLITIETSYLRNFMKVIYQASLEATEHVYSPLASSDFLLSNSQKKAGTMLIDIGYSSTSVVIWEDEELYSTQTIPIGSEHITQDLAVGLQTTIEMAGEIKKDYIDLSTDYEPEVETLEMHNPDLGINEKFKLSDANMIARARVVEIFQNVNKVLKKSNLHGKLAGGCLLIGGGVALKGIVDVAKEVLRIPVFKYRFDPSKIEFVTGYDSDPSFTNAIALTAYSLRAGDDQKPSRNFLGDGISKRTGSFFDMVKNVLPW